MRALMLAVLACLIATPAGAAINDFNKVLIENHFTRDTPIFVFFQDETEDDCLRHPKAIQSALELGVQRAGLRLTEAPGPSWVLYVWAFGQEIKTPDGQSLGLCTVSISARFSRVSEFLDMNDSKGPMYLMVDALVDGLFGVSPKHDMQNTIRSGATEIVDGFANEILKATQR